MDPAHRHGDMRGFDWSMEGSWQILHRHRERVETEGVTPLTDITLGMVGDTGVF